MTTFLGSSSTPHGRSIYRVKNPAIPLQRRLIGELVSERLSRLGRLATARVLRQGETKATWLLVFHDGMSYTLKIHLFGETSTEADIYFVGSNEERCKKEQWICSNNDWTFSTPQQIEDGHWQCRVASNCDIYYYVTNYIAGRRLSDLGRQSIKYKELFNGLGRACGQMKEMPVTGRGQKFDSKINSFSYDLWGDYIRDRRKSIDVDEILSSQTLSESELIRALEMWKNFEACSDSPGIFHHDLLYNRGNILIDQRSQSISAILDWEYAGCGPSVAMEVGVSDFAFFRNGLSEESRDTLISYFLDGFGISENEYRRKYKHYADAASLLYALGRASKLSGEANKDSPEICSLRDYIRRKIM